MILNKIKIRILVLQVFFTSLSKNGKRIVDKKRGLLIKFVKNINQITL